MICSISTGKCGSSWLDRLRSTKGFPTADGLDLDHFLLTNDDDNNGNHNSNSPESTQSDEKRVGENRKEVSSDRNGDADDDGGESEWLGIMSSVLSDLFNMGGETDRCRRKKSSRKQKNPRICVVSTVAAEDEEGRSSSGGCERKDENAPPENANANNAVDCGGVYSEAEEEEGEFDKGGGGERELFGFSRNEVTVIDTSCAEWKFEKLVYRRRNVWRVREKKGKSKIVGRKRRKGSRCDANADGKKRTKVSNPEGECVSLSKPGQSHDDDKSGEAGKGTSDDLRQVPKRRASLSTLQKKSKKGGSSVAVKGSPVSNNKSKSHKSHRSNFEFKQHEILCNKPLTATLQKGKEFGN